MERKKFTRIVRTTKLSAEEAARDRDIRAKVNAEFPPAKSDSVEAGEISAALKAALQSSPRSIYQICKDAGISQIVVTRFLSGERDIRLATADRLARVLGVMVRCG